jgi:hypothetical protein
LYHRQLSPGIEGLLGGHRGGIMQDRCFESYYADTRVKLKMVPCSPLTNRPYIKGHNSSVRIQSKTKNAALLPECHSSLPAWVQALPIVKADGDAKNDCETLCTRSRLAPCPLCWWQSPPITSFYSSGSKNLRP